ncbi:class F sortase [Nocardioides sp. SOB77]|uniref:Class F sortase n=1 Tax=Nocardioides oceani TaxID=3058369 RepID=A0ABT8FCV9_9ACTN|nr:class F sortase [Nocardioides oceani]MDN4172491.1 class F sortase [Nocardioides oceani]
MPDQQQTTSRGRGRAGLWLALAVAAALVVGGGVWLARDPGQRQVVTDQPSATPGWSTSPSLGTTAEAVPAPRRPGAPVRLRIPDLGVDAPVEPVKAPDRTLVPPSDPQRLGWWADGAKPGDREGSALVAGHTVHTGGGALDDLEQLTEGDRVVVRTDRGVLRYAVAKVRIYTKGRLASDAERLFSQDAPGRLVVITCEDWDGTRYLSNVVVTAVPV